MLQGEIKAVERAMEGGGLDTQALQLYVVVDGHLVEHGVGIRKVEIWVCGFGGWNGGTRRDETRRWTYLLLCMRIPLRRPKGSELLLLMLLLLLLLLYLP